MVGKIVNDAEIKLGLTLRVRVRLGLGFDELRFLELSQYSILNSPPPHL